MDYQLNEQASVIVQNTKRPYALDGEPGYGGLGAARYDYQLPSDFSYNYVGWGTGGSTDQVGYRILFSRANILCIQDRVNKYLINVIGKNIIVPEKQIAHLMSSLVKYNSPLIGDMYSMFIIPEEVPRNDVRDLNEQAFNLIVAQITEEERILKYNQSLTIWTTVLGEFNDQGLRAHPIIKRKERDVPRCQFNMRY